jgi:hypothetical protein
VTLVGANPAGKKVPLTLPDTQLFRKDGYGSTIEIGFWNARDKAFPSTKHPVQLKPVSSEKTVFVSNIPKQGL